MVLCFLFSYDNSFDRTLQDIVYKIVPDLKQSKCAVRLI